LLSFGAETFVSSLLSKINRNVILPVVLYGCETWPFPLRKERRLRVTESRVLRRMFGFKKDEAIGIRVRVVQVNTPLKFLQIRNNMRIYAKCT
jgi:hypothetical protein